MIKAVRGTRDLLPPDTDLWNFVESRVREICRRFNFREIRTPVFEATELFSRSVGEETDIVSKEMFTWEEGRLSSHLLFESAWLNLHGRGHDEATLHALLTTPSGRVRPDVLFRDGETWTIVEFRVGRDLHSALERMHLYLKAVSNSYQIDQSSIRLLLVTPHEPSPITLIRAREMRIEIEVFKDGFEEPESLTLRPENTAGVVRAYIEHGLDRTGILQKLYYIGPQFRRERPQKGRYRQFYQIGAEIIGPPSAGSELPTRDAEVLAMLVALLDHVGLTGWTLYLNSVGCAKDRPRYNEALREALAAVKHKMCSDCQRRIEVNPLRVLDCKVPEDQPIIEKLPKISQYLDEDCKQHFAEVRAQLDTLGISYQINERMVRGLDYYTKTTFEFTHGELGAQSAVLGGGRYDGLSESLGGPKAPGIGFAIGEDRLVLALQAQKQAVQEPLIAFVIPLGAEMNRHALKLAHELRAAGIATDIGDGSFRLKKGFETAEKLGAKFAVLVGENEVKSGSYAVKDLKSGEQVSVVRAELPAHLHQSK